MYNNLLGNIALQPYNIITKQIVRATKQNLIHHYRQKMNNTIQTDDKFETTRFCSNICWASLYHKIRSQYTGTCS